MNKRTSIVLVIVSILIVSTGFVLSTQKEQQRMVEVETSEGTVVISLYNETPQHRDNMIKLVQQGYYDGLLFIPNYCFYTIIVDFCAK